MESASRELPEGLRTSQKLKASSFHDDLRTVQKPNVNKETLMRGTPDTLPETPYSTYINTPFSSTVRNLSEPIFSFSDGIFSPVGGDLQKDLHHDEETSSIDKFDVRSPTPQKPLTAKRMMINSLGAIARSPTPTKNDEPRHSKRSIMMAFWDVAKTPPRKEKSLEELYEAVADSTIKKALNQDDEKASLTPSPGRKLYFAKDPVESESHFNGPNYASKYLSQFNDDTESDDELLLTPQSSPMKKKTEVSQLNDTGLNLSNYLAQFDDEEIEADEDLLLTPKSSSTMNKSSTPQSQSVSYLSNYLSQFDDDEDKEDDELLLTPLKDRLSVSQSDGSNYASKYLLQLNGDESEEEEELSFALDSLKKETMSTPRSTKIPSSHLSSPEDLFLDTSTEVKVGQANHEDELTLAEIHFNKMRSKVKPVFSSLPDCAVTPDVSVRSGASIHIPTNVPSLLSIYSEENMGPDDEVDEILKVSEMRSKIKPNFTSLPDCDVTPSTIRSTYSVRDPLTPPDLLSPRSTNDTELQELEVIPSSKTKYEGLKGKRGGPNPDSIQHLRNSIINDAAKLHLDPHLTKQIVEAINKSERCNEDSGKHDLTELSMVINSVHDDASEVSSLGSRSMMSKSTVLSEVLDKAMKTFASLDNIMKDFKRIQQATAIESPQNQSDNTSDKSPSLKVDVNRTSPSFDGTVTPMKAAFTQQAKKLSPVKEAPATPKKYHNKAVSFSDKLSTPIKPKKKESDEESCLVNQPDDAFSYFDADQNWVSFSPPKNSRAKAKKSSISKSKTQLIHSSVEDTVLSDFEKLQKQINATNQRMIEDKKSFYSCNTEKGDMDGLLKPFHHNRQVESDRKWNNTTANLTDTASNRSLRPPVHRMTHNKVPEIKTEEFNENRLWFAEYDEDGFLLKHKESHSSLLKKGISKPEIETKKQLNKDIDGVDQKKKSKTKKLMKRLKKLIHKTNKFDKDEGSLGIESVQSNMTSDTKKKKKFNFLKKLKRKKSNKPTNVAINSNIPCDVSNIDEEELKKTIQNMNMALSDLDLDSSGMSCSDSDLSQNCSSSSLNEEDGDLGYALLG